MHADQGGRVKLSTFKDVIIVYIEIQKPTKGAPTAAKQSFQVHIIEGKNIISYIFHEDKISNVIPLVINKSL